jgi:hypothetical protein
MLRAGGIVVQHQNFFPSAYNHRSVLPGAHRIHVWRKTKFIDVNAAGEPRMATQKPVAKGPGTLLLSGGSGMVGSGGAGGAGRQRGAGVLQLVRRDAATQPGELQWDPIRRVTAWANERGTAKARWRA